jgi:hypothetical protein
MNARAAGAEVAALAAAALWAYGGTALAVATLGDGPAASFGAAAAVVVLSYGLSRVLAQLDLDEAAFRSWGAGLSVMLLYLILRVEIAGEPYLWELGWLGDLLRDPGAALEGHAGDATEVAVLAAVWLRGVLRATQDLTYEGLLAEVSVGLAVVFLAAGFAPAAEAPAALRWLPAPYMVCALIALSLMHLGPVDEERRRPFVSAWALWVGGSLAAIAGLAALITLFDLSWFETVGRALGVAGRAVGFAVAYALSPFIIGVAWVMQHLVDWLVSGDEFTPEPTDTDEIRRQVEEEEREAADWSKALGYVLRSGIVALVIASAVVLLLLAFRRLRRREEAAEARELVEAEAGSTIADLRSLFAGALGRLPGRRAPFGRDAIGRLYGAVLRRAEAQGLARPPAATPLEFAVPLEGHFASPVPADISRSYAEARYGGRAPPPEELARLREAWRRIEGG